MLSSVCFYIHVIVLRRGDDEENDHGNIQDFNSCDSFLMEKLHFQSTMFVDFEYTEEVDDHVDTGYLGL